MFKRLNQYLLTHHPLLWNMRLPQLLAVNCIIHLFFCIAGYLMIDNEHLAYFSYSNITYNPELIMFSVLCSLVVLVVWLIFFLRNNAFRSYYNIGRQHLVKEFLLLLLIVFTSITYPVSWHQGIRAKGRSITSTSLLTTETNTVNQALAFIPFDKADYFVLNSCNARGEDGYYHTDLDTTVMAVMPDSGAYDGMDSIAKAREDSIQRAKRLALRQPGAVSYRHYCSQYIQPDNIPGILSGKQLNTILNRWLSTGRKDSVKYILDACISICRKYRVKVSLNTSQLAALPFADSLHTVQYLIKADEYSRELSRPDSWLHMYDLSRSLNFIASCQHANGRFFSRELLPLLYISLCLALVLACWRRFSKKIFLISLIGGALIFILFVLAEVASSSEQSAGIIFLLLFALFTTSGMLLLKSRSSKTAAGVLLSWHINMLPFVLLFAGEVISRYYEQQVAALDYPLNAVDVCSLHPVSCWVNANASTIAWLNFAFTCLYSIFAFSRLSRKWHILPEE